MAYYGQAAAGHYRLLRDQKPIDEWLADEQLDKKLRQQLQLVKSARQFATTKLGLPDNDSYLSYVDIQRDSVVWNVYASEPLAFKAVKSCFPVVGCLSYRGYFSLDDARQKSQQLAEQGYDTYVGRVIAYSTLGWFDDPMVSTIIKGAEYRIVGLIFHELAHQQLYIDDDTAFNEAFARSVEIEGILRWIQYTENPTLLTAYHTSQQRANDFSHLVLEYRNKLDENYHSQNTDAIKRDKKQQLFAALKQSYQRMKVEQWQGYTGYDQWFNRDLNNAHLLNIALYEDYVPAFRQLLIEQQNNLEDFYMAAQQLGKQPKPLRMERLQALKQRYLNNNDPAIKPDHHTN